MRTFVALLLCGIASSAFGQACDINLKTVTIFDKDYNNPGSGTAMGEWKSLSPISVAVIEAAMGRVAKAVDKNAKGGKYEVHMTGTKTCEGAATAYPPVDVVLISLKEINKINRAQHKEGDQLLKLSESAASKGKETPWNKKD